MLAHIQTVLNVTPEDTSVAGRINALILETKESTDFEQLKAALIACNALSAQLKSRIDHCAEVATNAAQHMPPNAGDVSAVASEVITKANKGSMRAKAKAIV